jgi:hypothetical protein
MVLAQREYSHTAHHRNDTTYVIASEAKQSMKQQSWIASSLALPCANAARLSQAMTG